MPHVVIAGGGFAGLSAALAFEKRMHRVRDLRITLVDRHNFMLFTPMLPEVAAGSVDARGVAQPYRALLRRVAFELGEVLGVDEKARAVHVRHPLTKETRALQYDELALALGATDATFGIQGVAACALPLKTLADAAMIRRRLLGAFEVAARTHDVVERDRLRRVVIVGGGFTGVECAGELAAFARGVGRYYPDAQQMEFVLLQREGRLLPHLPERFGRYAARVLRERGVEIVTGANVSDVDATSVRLADGTHYATRTIVWAAGSEPSPLAKRLGLKTSSHGAIETDACMRVNGHPHLWALGDIAAIPQPGGGTYAALAQNAVRQGPLLARNIIRALRGRSPKPFQYHALGQMASLGDRRAMAQLPGGAMLTGFPAWLLWRAYYLSRLPSAARRARVALDWTLGTAFPPQIARLPLVERGETSFEEMHAARR